MTTIRGQTLAIERKPVFYRTLAPYSDYGANQLAIIVSTRFAFEQLILNQLLCHSWRQVT
jgi:hypothetical protein